MEVTLPSLPLLDPQRAAMFSAVLHIRRNSMNQRIRSKIFLTGALCSLFLLISSGVAIAQCKLTLKPLAPLLDTLTVTGETLSPTFDSNNPCYNLSLVNSAGGSGRLITITVHANEPATLGVRDFSNKFISLEPGSATDIFVPAFRGRTVTVPMHRPGSTVRWTLSPSSTSP